MPKSSLYIHIPYCRNKCIYCDFYSGGARIADWDRLNVQLLKELEIRKEEISYPLTSIYFGGGTPSLLPSDTLNKLMQGIKDIVKRSERGDGDGRLSGNDILEITLEVNPEDASQENIKLWKEIGINRISAGVQSLSDTILQFIGRKHSAKQSREALRLLTTAFNNVSADLIFGLPGQSLSSFESDLTELIESGVKHISCYSLMFEPGTALYELRRLQKLEEAEEGLSQEMYTLLTKRLENTGFHHYEISNFAKPGYESRHNSGYWTGRQYLGIGPSANSYDGFRTRRANPWKLKEYLNFDFSNSHFYEEEILTDEELLEEMIMLSLRTSEGLNLEDFKARFGDTALNQLLGKAAKSIGAGNLNLTSSHLSLTRQGILISDSIIVSII